MKKNNFNKTYLVRLFSVIQPFRSCLIPSSVHYFSFLYYLCETKYLFSVNWRIRGHIMKYVDVILPLPLANTFTYSVPDEWADVVRIGMRVVVPFGKKKMYTAVIYVIHSVTPTIYEAKDILCLLDNEPILRHPQLKFWDWVSLYYQAFLGDVYQAAIPAGLKLESETQVRINPDYEAETLLSEKEQKLLDALSDGKTTTVTELNKITEMRDTLPTLKQLLEKGAVEISEELTEKFRAKTDTFVRLTEEALQEENLRKLFEDLSRAKKQLDMLMMYIDLSKCLIPLKKREVSRKDESSSKMP